MKLYTLFSVLHNTTVDDSVCFRSFRSRPSDDDKEHVVRLDSLWDTAEAENNDCCQPLFGPGVRGKARS